MLKVNKTLKSINLFSNTVDVDGARSLKEALLVNKTLEHLDIGFNRLRDKGAIALAEGLAGNTSMKSISLRFNFITDDGFGKFFELALGKANSLKNFYIRNNTLSEYYLHDLNKLVHGKRPDAYVDILERLEHLDKSSIDNSIWISPANDNFTVQKLRNFFEDTHKCGIVKDVRVYKGIKVAGKPNENRYAFIEFMHPNSVPRSLRVASKKKSFLDGVRFRIYKAGSRTLVYLKPPKSKVAATRGAPGARGGMRGGRGGRGGFRGGR
jgi:hypothetical protein